MNSESLKKLKKDELKRLCKEKGLGVSGNKKELIERLLYVESPTLSKNSKNCVMCQIRPIFIKKSGLCNTCRNRCKHGIQKNFCIECGGTQICKHQKKLGRCDICGGNELCKHGIAKNDCYNCEGGSTCSHKKRKRYCRECEGNQFCEHNIIKSTCKECEGSQVCEHKVIRSKCSKCEGGSICHHKKQRQHCQICDPIGHLGHTCCNSIYRAIKKKELHTIEYLGCDYNTLKEHLEKQFKE
jgi:hypothetical protein